MPAIDHGADNTHWGWHSLWPAPAKLNLFLHVTGRRADGYHTLQTLFRFVDYGDSLHFSPDAELRLGKPLPGLKAEDDLCLRAARLLQQATAYRQGACITLDKRLPMGGGLGGGSSDAATVLLALNHLWGTGLKRHELQTLGLELGADVPVFVFGDNAFAEGIGEKLRPVELPAAWYLVLEPPVAVPTAQIFQAPDLRRDSPMIAASAWQGQYTRNDLRPVAQRLFPVIAQYADWLEQFAPARMTGSGACVFAEFASEALARKACEQMPTAMKGWLAKGLTRHPLRELGGPA